MYRTGYNDATLPQIHLKGVMKGLQSQLNTEENANKLYKEKKTDYSNRIKTCKSRNEHGYGNQIF